MEEKRGPYELTYDEMQQIRARRFYDLGLGAEGYRRPCRMLREADTDYTRDERTARDFCFTRFEYFITDAAGHSLTGAVWCHTLDGLMRLLNHWNGQPTQFKYWY